MGAPPRPRGRGRVSPRRPAAPRARSGARARRAAWRSDADRRLRRRRQGARAGGERLRRGADSRRAAGGIQLAAAESWSEPRGLLQGRLGCGTASGGGGRPGRRERCRVERRRERLGAPLTWGARSARPVRLRPAAEPRRTRRRGGGRQDEASWWGQSRCRVWSYGRWDWRSGGHAGAVGGVERAEAGGDRKSGWLNEPGRGLGPSGGDNRLVMASFAEVANRASGLGS